MRRLATRSAAALCALAAAPALACPVCGETYGPARWAYFVMTLILSLLPLALIGGVIGAVVIRARRAEAEAARAQPAPRPPAPAPGRPG